MVLARPDESLYIPGRVDQMRDVVGVNEAPKPIKMDLS